MADERTLQPDEELNKESDSEEEGEEESGEEEPASESEETGGEGETVTLSKEDHQKLLTERDNYKKVALAAKKRDTESEKSYVTVDDRYRSLEKEAITSVTTINESDTEDSALRKQSIDAHWDEIKDYIPIAKIDKRTATQKDVEQVIIAGYGAWKEATGFDPSTVEDEQAELATDAGKGGKTPPPAPKERKSIIPKHQSMKEWYGKPES